MNILTPPFGLFAFTTNILTIVISRFSVKGTDMVMVLIDPDGFLSFLFYTSPHKAGNLDAAIMTANFMSPHSHYG